MGAFVKDTMNVSTAAFQHLNESPSIIECIWFTIVNHNMRKIIVGIIYRPPGSSTFNFCKRLEDKISQINIDSNNDIFLLGDFNINYNNKNSDEMRHLINFERMTGLKQLNSPPGCKT